jgi:hypothetical protein
MEIPKLTRQYFPNTHHSLTVKLALKTPKKSFSDPMLTNVAHVTGIDLQIISKLSGINSDRWDWYFIEVLGAYNDLVLAIVCWQELGVKNIWQFQFNSCISK